jgi:hypothetical protein
VSIRGSVDIVTTKGATGWAYVPGRQDGITVQAVLSHEIIGAAIATDHRPDLAAVGVGNGDCGYTIKFCREIDPLYLPFVTFKVDGGDTELPRDSHAGFSEFFTVLYRAYPTAGRQRSVFGGLWTDRTDAAAILRGKTAIGQVPIDDALIIDRLIHNGIAVVEANVSLGWSPKAAMVKMVAEIVDQPTVLRALQPILDDKLLVFKAEIIKGHATELNQPSAENELPSPAECLAVIVPVSDSPIEIDIVRGSHHFPEFTLDGVSRWLKPRSNARLASAAAEQGLLDRYAVEPGSAAVIGSGAVYSVRADPAAPALRLFCAPMRALPVSFLQDHNEGEAVSKTGARIWL